VVFLGIDGGGSKTAFVLEDETGNELDRAETGPSNWLSSGPEEAQRNIAAGILQLKTHPEIVAGGFAGAGRPEGIRFYTDCLSSLLPDTRIFVETDAFISYIGAIGLTPGVLLIAGTGSIAIGRRSDGRMIRVGGWGPMFSDEGSGFWIGREAIRSALLANDFGNAKDFVASICRALQLDSITDVNAAWKSGNLTVRSVAALATLLFDQSSSEPASRILNEAAAHLAAIAETAIAQVGVDHCKRSIAGSIGSSPVMREILRRQSGLEFQTPAHPPEHGAVIWARSQALR
jgi:N-acetylglucosamine kinase-like BadF-type ATPase